MISSIMYEEKASIGGRRDIISLKSGDLFLRFLGLTQERQSALNLLKKMFTYIYTKDCSNSYLK